MVASLAAVLHHTHSTVFRKTSEVTITRSKWIMTFVINLGSYRKILWDLEHGVTVASELRVHRQLNQLERKGKSNTVKTNDTTQGNKSKGTSERRKTEKISRHD